MSAGERERIELNHSDYRHGIRNSWILMRTKLNVFLSRFIHRNYSLRDIPGRTEQTLSPVWQNYDRGRVTFFTPSHTSDSIMMTNARPIGEKGYGYVWA